MSATRRRSQRIPCDITVRRFRFGQPTRMVARDLNLHGLFLCTDERPPRDSLWHLEVALPDGTVTMFARARFVGETESGHGVGLEIFVMDEGERQRFSNYYRALLRAFRRDRRVAAAQARERQADGADANALTPAVSRSP